MCTKSQLEAIEEEMVNYYRSVYGDSIDTIILYGSYARGDYSDDSDIDITAIVSACIRNAECNLQLFKKGMLKNIRPDKNEE